MYNIDWAAIRSGASAVTLRGREGRAATAAVRVSPVVWALGFTSLLTDISSEMVSSVLPVYLLLHLHVSPAALGVIDGLYQGFALLVRLAAGVVGDKWRRHKAVAFTGYALSAVCRLGMMVVGNAWTGIAAIVASDRIGKGIRTAPRDALIARSTPPADLARAFGVHRALDAAGALIGPLVAFAILARLPDGYDVLFMVSFGVAVIGAGVIAIFVSEPRESAAGGSAAPRPRVLDLLRDARLRGITLATAVLSVATISDSFIFLSLQQHGGFAPGYFPLLFVGVALANLVCSAPFGRLADRVGRVTIFLAGHVCLIGAYALLLLAPGAVPAGLLCLALVGAYYAATDGVLAALTSASLPAQHCGSGLAIVASATNLGRLAASLVFGLVWASRGLQQATVFFMIAMGLAFIVSVFLLRAPSAMDARDTAS